MGVQRIMKKLFALIISISLLTFPSLIYADTSTDSGIDYLKSKQDSNGQITGGSFSDASPWAAIAFGANGIDVSNIKNGDNSLKDYLQNNGPSTSESAAEWEKWILAIVASGGNPYNFGGVDYVTTLKSSPFYNSNQIGDTNGVNDDWFGVMALVAAGVGNSDTVLTDAVSFIIAKQNGDGGWGYAVDADSDSNDTAAAIQALVAAKNIGVTNDGLDDSINNAKTYLLSTRHASTGGFLYDTMPWSTDPDIYSTSWALMSLNVLGMESSTEATSAKTWLLSQQSNDDSGFLALDWNTFTYVSNSSATADTLTALSGKGWVVSVYIPTDTSPSPTPTPTPIPPATSSTTITPSEIKNLVTSGYFSIPSSSTSSATPSITTAQKVTINVAVGSGTNSVMLPQGVIIRRSDGANIDTNGLSTDSVSIGSVSGLGSNVTVDGAFQWGIPGIGLEFTSPITINIYVGTDLNSQTLNIQRSITTSSGWTNDGIVDPKTCVVSEGICSFTTIKASYFAATRTTSTTSSTSQSSASPTPTPTPSPTPSATPTTTANSVTETTSPQPTGQVLGESTTNNISAQPEEVKEENSKKSMIYFAISLLSLMGAFLWWRTKIRK